VAFARRQRNISPAPHKTYEGNHLLGDFAAHDLSDHGSNQNSANKASVGTNTTTEK
jgi:hypothetical protein